MKILFFGDSITESGRDYQASVDMPQSYGMGYVNFVAAEILSKDPLNNTVINRGEGGDKIVDLYARIRRDVWNLEPDFLSILIGVNDVLHENSKNGVEIDRFDKLYRMIVEETKQRLPNTKILICEPFLMLSEAGTNSADYKKIKLYAKKVQKIEQDYGLYFLSLQDALEEKVRKYDLKTYFYDGIHPSITGAKLIADEWLKKFKEIQEGV